MDDSPHSEKDHSVERKIKKPKGEMKSDSEKESNVEVDPKGEKNKKYTEAERRDGGRRPHRELDIHQKRGTCAIVISIFLHLLIDLLFYIWVIIPWHVTSSRP